MAAVRRAGISDVRGRAGAVQPTGGQYRAGAAHPGGRDAREATAAGRGAGAAGRHQDDDPAPVFVLPAMFVVILGPMIPRLQSVFGTLTLAGP